MAKQLLNRSTFQSLFCGMILLLAFNSQAMLPPSGKTPCWMQNLSGNGFKNIYGVANRFSASFLPPLHFAKVNAVNNWLTSEGKERINFNDNLADKSSIRVGELTLHFNDIYQTRGQVYVLVSDNKDDWTAKNCSIPRCNLKQCSPGWLCDNKDEEVTILGVSGPVTHPNDRLKLMIENAQNIARTLNKSSVSGSTDLLQINQQFTRGNNIQARFQIKEIDKSRSSVKVGNMCHIKGTLISEIVFERSTLGQNHDWLNTPNLNGTTGVVGYASGTVSTGRVSDLIEVAARKGLFELAKSKNLQVSSDSEVKVTSGGHYSLVTTSNLKTESIVSAFIADMKMELNNDLQPKVYIWLLENKG